MGIFYPWIYGYTLQYNFLHNFAHAKREGGWYTPAEIPPKISLNLTLAEFGLDFAWNEDIKMLELKIVVFALGNKKFRLFALVLVYQTF